MGQGSASVVQVYPVKEWEEQPAPAQEWPWRALHRPMPSPPATESRAHFPVSLLLPAPAFEAGRLRLARHDVAYSSRRIQECSLYGHIPTTSSASLLKQPGGH